MLTTLLATGLISEITFAGLIVPLAMVCVVLLCLPRLRELDLKNLKMTLAELQQVKAEIEEVKAEVVEMYGGIERIRKAPLVLDESKMRELGLKPDTLPMISAVMRYTAGCVKRERERLARSSSRQNRMTPLRRLSWMARWMTKSSSGMARRRLWTHRRSLLKKGSGRTKSEAEQIDGEGLGSAGDPPSPSS